MADIKFNVYALCYNEETILPYFLHHYRQAENIFVFDNMSTDKSREIVEKAGRNVYQFSTNGTFDDGVHKKLKDEMWCNSVGKVDYVIVQDMDEFVFFPEFPDDIKAGLGKLKERGVNGGVCRGYEMCNVDGKLNEIKESEPLFRHLYKGYPRTNYNKPLIFDPTVVEKTWFEAGQHDWHPVFKENVQPNISNKTGEVLLLHYKHLGYEYECEKRLNMAKRQSIGNRVCGLSTEYSLSEEEIRSYTKQFYENPEIQDLREILKI